MVCDGGDWGRVVTKLTCEKCKGDGTDFVDRTGGPDKCCVCEGRGFVLRDCSRLTGLAIKYAQKVPVRP